MKCDFCGYIYTEKASGKVCIGCPMIRVCKKVKCSNCGYEAYPEPRLIKWIRDRRREKHDRLSNDKK